MRTTIARKVKHATFARKPRSYISLRTLRTKAKRIHPLALVKRNPYSSLGIALGLSAISGFAAWMFNRR